MRRCLRSRQLVMRFTASYSTSFSRSAAGLSHVMRSRCRKPRLKKASSRRCSSYSRGAREASALTRGCRSARRSTRNLMPEGIVLNCSNSASRGLSSARLRATMPRAQAAPPSAAPCR